MVCWSLAPSLMMKRSLPFRTQANCSFSWWWVGTTKPLVRVTSESIAFSPMMRRRAILSMGRSWGRVLPAVVGGGGHGEFRLDFWILDCGILVGQGGSEFGAKVVAVGVGHGAAELGGGPAPDGEFGGGVALVAGDDVPVDVGGLVAEAFVVDAEGAEDFADGVGCSRGVLEDAGLLGDGEVGEVLVVVFEDEDAPAGAALVVAKEGDGFGEFGDEEGVGVGEGLGDLGAEGAGHGGLWGLKSFAPTERGFSRDRYQGRASGHARPWQQPRAPMERRGSIRTVSLSDSRRCCRGRG